MHNEELMKDALKNRKQKGLNISIILGEPEMADANMELQDESEEQKEKDMEAAGMAPMVKENPDHEEEAEDKELMSSMLEGSGLGRSPLKDRALANLKKK